MRDAHDIIKELEKKLLNRQLTYVLILSFLFVIITFVIIITMSLLAMLLTKNMITDGCALSPLQVCIACAVPCPNTIIELTQPRSQGLSSLPPLVVGIETLVAAGHVTTQNLGGRKICRKGGVYYRPLDQMYLSTHPPCGFG